MIRLIRLFLTTANPNPHAINTNKIHTIASINDNGSFTIADTNVDDFVSPLSLLPAAVVVGDVVGISVPSADPSSLSSTLLLCGAFVGESVVGVDDVGVCVVGDIEDGSIIDGPCVEAMEAMLGGVVVGSAVIGDTVGCLVVIESVGCEVVGDEEG